MAESKTITVEIEADIWDIEGPARPLTELFEWVDAIKVKVPPSRLSAARMRLEIDQGFSFSVWYERPETDAERQARERTDREREAQSNAIAYAREKELYERLKKKFEG